jgi:hypothetical protein
VLPGYAPASVQSPLLVSLASRPSADIGGITDAVPSRPVSAACRPC